MSRPLVLGIGLAKTGTTSLNAALEVLGFRSLHYPNPALMLAGRFEQALSGYDAATDITVSAFTEQLDRGFPGSRFILTHRDIDEWLPSIRSHLGRIDKAEWTADNPKGRVREMIFGTVGWDEDLFIESYARHTERVRAHFARRPGDLLEVNLCAGSGWEPLCRFLGRPIPDAPFPHSNKRPDAVAAA